MIVYEVGFADKLKILGAKCLGFTDASPRECIALMDRAKELWRVNIVEPALVDGKYGRPSVSTDHPVTAITGREYLQNLGNEARQVFGDTFWIDMVLPRPSQHPVEESRAVENYSNLTGMYPDVDVIAITDLRYDNEAERVLDLGGEVWEVLRPGTGSDGHASEQPLPRHLVTRQINNVSTLDNLLWEVEKAAELAGLVGC